MTLEEKLLDNGLEGAVYLTESFYDEAAIGYSDSGCVIYDYDMLVESLMKEGMSSIDAMEWIDYNILRATPYYGDKAPIIMYKFEE